MRSNSTDSGAAAAPGATPRARLVPGVAAMAATVLVVIAFRPILVHPSRVVWAAFAAMLLAAWLPLLLARHRVPSMLAATLWLVVVANILVTPLLASASLHRYFALPPHLNREVHVSGDVMPGLDPVAHVSTDALGFRTSRPIDYEHKDPAVLRIATIGASTTEQIYVDDRKTWSSLLAEDLQRDLGRPVEVINTGLSGLRAVHHYKTLKFLEPYGLDAAVFLMGVNDWNRQIRDTVAPRGAWSAAEFQIDHSLLWKVGVQLRASASGATDGAFYARQNDSLNRAERRSVEITGVSDDYREWVTRILDECRAAHIRCIFLDQPSAYRASISAPLRRLLWMTPPDEPYTLSLEQMARAAQVYNDWLGSAVREHGQAFCPVADRLEASTADFYDDCHFNAGGTRKVADAVRACVEAAPTAAP